MNQAATPLRMKIVRHSNLLGLELQRDLTEAELAAIRTVLRIHDHDDEAPCYCAWQFPAKVTLEDVWADAARRARLADPDPGSAEWVRRQPGYLPPITGVDLAAPGTVDRTATFRQPGERVNGLYQVVPPTRTLHLIVECRACAIDVEQCHADLDCEARAWANGWCMKHQPVDLQELANGAQPVRPDTDSDHEMMVAGDTID